jgi:ribosome-associated heat shock protein Hsp15
MRIDKLLWFLRLTKTRSLAQALAEAGHIRVNGRRVDRAHHAIGSGDVLVLPLGGGVRVIELLSVPTRRGPAPEARACYRVLEPATLDDTGRSPIAAGPRLPDAAERDLQP